MPAGLTETEYGQSRSHSGTTIANRNHKAWIVGIERTIEPQFVPIPMLTVSTVGTIERIASAGAIGDALSGGEAPEAFAEPDDPGELDTRRGTEYAA